MKKTKILFTIFILLFVFYNNAYAFPSFNFLKKFFITKGFSTVEEKIVSKGIKKYIAGRTVVINNKNFSLTKVDALGRSNCQRMKVGLAPLGHDGLPINLHHLHQQNDGHIIEILESEHRHYTKELHSYKKTSEIDRKQFSTWKLDYWKQRGASLCK